MNEPATGRDDDAARAEALFRYRVIAPLLDEREEDSLRARITTLAGERHLHPRRGEISLSGRTLWIWLSQFRRGGIAALHPRHRRDRGSLRAAPPAVLERAEFLRREVPKRWTSTVLDILIREGAVTKEGCPHRATVDRYLRRRGARGSSRCSARSARSRCSSRRLAICGSAITTTGPRCSRPMVG